MKPKLNIYFINGPPSSGKDTLADGLIESNGGIKFRLAEPIRTMLYSIFPYINDNNIDDLKNKKLLINGVTESKFTGRQFMIDYGENFIKSKFGKHIFIQLLIGKILNLNKNDNISDIYISDLGFKEELHYIINSPVIGNRYDIKFYLIRLHCENCSFDNDSRNYIEFGKLEYFKYSMKGIYDIENKKNGISNFIEEAQNIINKK